MYEQVTGPFNGYFVAAYACEIGELGEQYLGFYKICAIEPASYWESECLIKGCCKQQAASGADALRAAEADARSRLQTLPAAIELQAARERRPLYWLELEELKH
jgi:hypothetical protein